jgi:Ca-activated chloride channel homolog
VRLSGPDTSLPRTDLRMRYAAILSGVALALLLATPEGQETPTIRADVNLVQLNVRVTDAAGRTVSGLRQEAFELLVDGAPHPITVFQGEDVPVAAGIVVDNSASMAPKRSDVVTAALTFARANNPRDQMFVVHFNQLARFGLMGVPFTGNLIELERAVSQFQLGGTTALYDALIQAIDHFALGTHSRRVLLVITDGRDNSSRATLEDALSQARTHDVAIYAIGIWASGDEEANPQALSELAQGTGGRAFFPRTSAEIPSLCEEIARDIRRQYTLGFAGAQDGQYHHIQVKITDPHYSRLTVETRPGYFAVKNRD